MSNPKGQLVLAAQSTAAGKPQMWFLSGAIVVGGFVLVRYLEAKPDWHLRFCNQPHLVAAVCGLLWWLFLAPSVVGLAVVLLTLLSLVIRRARKPRRGQDNSTPLALGTN